MTDIATARAQAADAFLAAWGATTTVVIEDEGFTDAGDLAPPVDPPSEWARFSVRHLSGRPGAPGPQVNLGGIGNRKFERAALGMIQIFTDLESGALRGDQLGQQALAIFEAKRISDLECVGGRVYEGGKDGRWRMTMVEIPFYYQETK